MQTADLWKICLLKLFNDPKSYLVLNENDI